MPDFSHMISSVTYHGRYMSIGPRQAVMCNIEYIQLLSLPVHLVLPEHNGLCSNVYLICLKESDGEEIWRSPGEDLRYPYGFSVNDKMAIKFPEQAMGSTIRGYGGVSGVVPCILYWRDKFWTSIADCVPNIGDLSAMVRKSLGISNGVTVELVYEIEAFDIPELEFSN